MSFATKVKKVLLKKVESKIKHTQLPKAEMFHNRYTNSSIWVNSPTSMPSQGVSDSQRVGDQINMSGIMIRLLLGGKFDRPNLNFQYYVLKVPKGSTYNYTQWFDQVLSLGNVLLDPPNTDFVKVLKRGVWKYNGGDLDSAGNREVTFVKKIWIPYKKLVKFGPADAATTHNDEDIYFLMAPYDAFGTLTTDNVAYFEGSQSIYYKDP